MGILGGHTDLSIIGNTISGNNVGCDVGTACGFSHGLYIGSGQGFTSYYRRIVIRGNTVVDNSLDANGNCDGGSITIHGRFEQVLIEENTIETTTGTPTTDCYGISMNDGYDNGEFIRNLIVRANTVANVGNVCIESNIGINVLYENNKCIKTRAGGNAPNIAIVLTDDVNSQADGPVTGNNAIVRNNTCYITVAASGSCLSVSAGTGHQVFNNIAYLGASATANCWSPSAIGNFTVWDNNQCYELGSGQWSGSYANLAAAQAAGYDTNGSSAEPLFSVTPSSANGWNLALSANSTGRNTDKPLRDVSYSQRANPPTRGAYEFGGTPTLAIRAPVHFY
jgi:hypothetical protein